MSPEMCRIFLEPSGLNANGDFCIIWAYSDNIELPFVVKTYSGTVRGFNIEYRLDKIMNDLEVGGRKHLPDIPTVIMMETSTHVYTNSREIRFEDSLQTIEILYREYTLT